ncbi:DUF7529 family protein [Halorubrum lacusprofundi]|jgi:hypothetical protein|uniref:Uncharacterized protein n=1 Tax=Halorubrum lacusprofundi (strain ATCC 49239 / DSM 5036 / JCM 8891 / ACAM 34) TaxID=416348 RepID=B9LQR7_HALLT|nr:hypothetical protein [Halorubrum lacusprofundi]ACM55669.1 conserved hypothetical protein [Halorubrum lacusprofundi ATCC 49239]MCG1007137.1 hypothetical protein [Halorubrum lacusprofundi]
MVRTEPNGSDTDDAQRRAQTVKQSKAGLQQTIADMKAMAADREEAGYETLTVAAGDTTPKTPDTGESDEWGLSYVVPSNVEDEFVALYDRASFDEIGVYQADAEGIRFIVTEYLDHDEQIAVFIAGTFRLQFAAPLARTALDRGHMYTHVKKLDGTHLGSIDHDDPDAFFPDPESVYAYER